MSGDAIARRAAAGRIAAAALLPLAALGLPLSSVGAVRRRNAAPAGDYVLERVLVRELGPGTAIVVTRRWRVGFAARDAGLEVRGEQNFAAVDAPPSLAAIAALERARSASGVFPLVLDGDGLISPSSHVPGAEALVLALDTGRAMFQSLPRSAADIADGKVFMARLAGLSARAISMMPRDLFFPRPGTDRTSRDIGLPGGATGTIEVTTQTRARLASGLLESSERRIATRFEGSERIASERWSLAPA